MQTPTESNSPPLRTAIIGTSRVGSFFEERLAASPELIPSSHAAWYAAHPRTQLVAGCDIGPDRLEAFGQKWGIKALYSDFQEMLAKEKPDVVSVCTSWGHTHDEIVPEVARSGVRAIWAEKPLATSMAKANEIIHAVETNGVKLQGTYPRRWTPRYQAVRAMIDRGEIGDVISVTIVGAAGLIHNGTHDTDAMTYFAGDPEPAFAVGQIAPEALDGRGRPIQEARGSRDALGLCPSECQMPRATEDPGRSRRPVRSGRARRNSRHGWTGSALGLGEDVVPGAADAGGADDRRTQRRE